MDNPRLSLFLRLSSDLTGFDRFELAGTGMAETYLATLDAILPPGLADAVMAAWYDPDAITVGHTLYDDQKIGPVARAIILLWYRGAWTALPEAWRKAYGASPRDVDHVVSGAAYKAGLQWAVAGGHPAGADAQGYAAWAAPPAVARPS